MRKKGISIFILLFAFTIYLAHGIIPHNHHHGHHHHHLSDHDHGASTHHHGDIPDDGLNNILSFLIHSEGEFTNTGNHALSKIFIKHLVTANTLIPSGIHIHKTEIPPLIIYSPPESNFFISYIARFSGLRAPPIFTA